MTARTRTHLLISLLLVALSLVAFWQVLHADFVNYDDPLYVTKNRHVQAGLTHQSVSWAFTAMHSANWHPLTWLSHMLDWRLYKLEPTGHHLTSLLFHIANSLLLFLVLSRMTGSVWRSAFVAALFAVHPLHVESVAWVAERKDVLSTFFWMLTMLAYVHYAKRPNLKRYVPVFLALALGLMAKPMLVTLPLVLLLMDYWPLKRLEITPQADSPSRTGDERPETPWKLVWEKVPLFALAGASCAATYLAQGKEGVINYNPLGVRAANALVAYVGYIWKMIWPRGLAVFYPHPGDTLPTWQVIGAGLALAAASLLVIRAAPRRPYLAAGWLWYVLTLVPVIGLMEVGLQSMADRYTYVPLIGIFVMLAWGVPDIVRSGEQEKGRGDAEPRRRKDKRRRRADVSSRRPTARALVLAALAAAVLAALTGCTWTQVGHWRNTITLFEHAIEVTANNYIAHDNLGLALAERGDLDGAIAHYSESVRIKPDYPRSHNNLGLALYEKGDLDGAIEQYSKALELAPNLVEAYNNLGNALLRRGEFDEALSQYAKARGLKPEFAPTYANTAAVLYFKGEYAEAWMNIRKCRELGGSPAPRLIELLSEKMAEPE